MTIHELIIARLEENLRAFVPTNVTQPTKERWIKYILQRLQNPLNVKSEILPVIFTAYGGTREAPPGLVQTETMIFSMIVYAIVKELPKGYFDDDSDHARTLLQASADMQALMRKVAVDMNTFALQTEDAVVERVRLGRVRSGEGKFEDREFLQFTIDYYLIENLPY